MVATSSPAAAAPNLSCVGTIYLTSSTSPGTVLSLNTSTGAAGTTSLYQPTTGATGNPNQVGVAFEGARVVNTDRSTNSIVNYSPGPETRQTLSFPGIATYGIAGAVNPANGLFYFGGFSGNQLHLFAYNPQTNTASATEAAIITAPNAPGGNGDIAFDPSGNLYFVSSSTTAYALYSLGGPSPTTAAASVITTGTPGGGAAVNGIAFGSDNFLYISLGAVTTGTAQPSIVRQVNPISGQLTGTSYTMPANVNATDLASCAAAPSSLTVKENLPNGRVNATDQFTVSAVRPASDNASVPFPSGTTTGADTGLQDEPSEVTGPAIITGNSQYSVTQAPAAGSGTDLNNYATTWACSTQTGAVVASGTGSTGTFTAPSAGGTAVTCVFTNTALRPSLSLVKSVSPTTFTAVGQTLTYTFAVANTGNVALSNVQVNDSRAGLGPITCTPIAAGGTLPVGATTTCTATYTVTQADVNAGVGITNTATATGTPPAGSGLPPATSTPSTATSTYAVVPPTATNDSDTTPFDTAVTLPATANDTAGSSPVVPGATVFTAAGATNGGKNLTTPQGTWAIQADGTALFTPAPGYVGTTPPVQYRITDQNGLTATATLTVTVRQGPTALPDTATTPQDTDVTLNPLINDTPGLTAGGGGGTFDTASVTFPATGQPAGAVVAPGGKQVTVPGQGTYTIASSGQVTFDPLPTFTGVASPIAYAVNDQAGNATGSTITITVTPSNPVANDDAASAQFNSSATLPAGTDDTAGPGGPINQSLTVFTSPSATNGGKTLVTAEGTWQVQTDGTVIFTPNPGYTGTTAPVEYRITDTNGQTDTADLVVTIRPGPTAAPDSETTAQNVDVDLPILVNDTPGRLADNGVGAFDPAAVLFPTAGQPAGATVTNNGRTITVPGQGSYTVDPATGVVTFDPAPQFNGTTTPVSYTVVDQAGNPTGSTITVAITAVTPVAVGDGANTPINTPVTIPVTDNDLGNPGHLPGRGHQRHAHHGPGQHHGR
ncbi:Ig-like domain-containing protein [Nocardioides sp. C4-1]|uniref:beta strand repeat-containing protein n=1 Tax=Nocardioides sp. C4-1 TaxID=3151851 RepID=UPI003263367C